MASKLEPKREATQKVDNKGRQKRKSTRRLPRLYCAIFSLAALTTVACATGGSAVDGEARDTARVARNTAREAQQSLVVVESKVEQTREQLSALTSVMETLALAIAADDKSGIAAAAEELGKIEDLASQAAENTNTEDGTDEPATPEDTLRPGLGVNVRMGRANWSTGYLQAHIFKQLLEELGYTVNGFSTETDFSPRDFYAPLAKGEYDFWVNGWFPAHDIFISSEELLGEMGGEQIPAEFVTTVGLQIESGALQGFLVDKKTADELGITSLADIAENPDPWDYNGNGKADLAGCDDGWGCQAVIAQTLTLNNFDDSIEQISGEYDELWAEQLEHLENGDPVLAYTWTPSAYITQLVPGQNAYWITVPSTILDQRGAARLPAEQCPDQPCEMGFRPADIQVVANNQFLENNPAAAKIFELVKIDVIDVALQNVRYGRGQNTEADIANHAAEWIADNRAVVDDWLIEARAAA